MARRPRKADEAAPTTPDPVEIAMEAEATGQTPGGAARRILERQAHLIGWQIANERASVALRILTGLTGVIAAVIIGLVLLSASQYRGLTVQPFSVPPELEARGLNGSAVATRVLDKLTAIQAATISLRAGNTYANSWGDEVEVQIPQTGVSAGELWRFLRSWLGQEVKITGEVVRTPGGLQVTARAGGQPAPVFTGPEAELEATLDQAAEAIFASTQPYRYIVYLSRIGRTEDAVAAARALAYSGSRTDRLWALAGGANILGDAGHLEEALASARAAVAMDPGFGLAWANMSGVEYALGRIDDANRHSQRAARLMHNDANLNQEIAAGFIREIGASVIANAHDHQKAVEMYGVAAESDASSGRGARASQAVQMAVLRDVSGGRRTLAATGDIKSEDGRAQQRYFSVTAAAALEDWPATVSALEAIIADAGATPAAQAEVRVAALPRLATARAKSGDLAGAEAALSGATPDVYFTLIAEGEVAAVRGDTARSDRAFARAIRLGPGLADAEQAWGEARLARGDRAGAIAQFEAASRKAPRWADPLKGWGQALAAQGDLRGAIRKYDAAADRAPRWGALHIAWGRALLAAGRSEEARTKFRAAATMDLSPADRAALPR